MREILFRGKRDTNGEWIEGFYSEYNASYNSGVSVIETRQDDYCVDRYTVCQFTGLLDKNGKKIFEGDIVFHKWSDWREGEIEVVEWDDDSCGFEPFSDSRENCGHCGGGILPKYCEVIGNIFDNPELLEEKSDG